MMNYEEVIKYLTESVPMFQQIGKAAYKEGLDTTLLLDSHFNHPHRNFKTIHVAGTNGKGSCSHTIASILQQSGYKVGLFTSPHLIDFRERIRVNGVMADKEFVRKFVVENIELFDRLKPSFFELTTAMAFKYFEECKVDIAVIEVGMGGRLDCTNIITPVLSIITNIGFDHMQFLGNTLEKIASEKAGIIKKGVPVVIGETKPETRKVFADKAAEVGAPIHFAEDEKPLVSWETMDGGGFIYKTANYGEIEGELGGIYQIKNTNTILCALDRLKEAGINIPGQTIREGFAEVCLISGFMGRWQKINSCPLTVCDAGHNIDGISYVVRQLGQCKYNKLHIVMGMVNDKDIDGVLELLPKDAHYIFTKASIRRALDEHELLDKARKHGLEGETAPTVKEALATARKAAGSNDMIFVGGSCFIVADLLAGK